MANENTKVTAEMDAKLKAELDALKARAAKAGEQMMDRGDDVVGYWDYEAAPIVCRPMSVKLFDSGIEPSKPSALVIVQLEDSTLVEDAEKKGSKKLGRKGELVGVWYKAGMKGIVDTAGVTNVITYTGTKKIKDRPQPMKTFSVKASGGKRLPISQDSRAKSRGTATPFDVQQPAEERGPAPEADDLAF